MVKILIFRTDRIGDLLVNCPIIISIKNHFKLSKITFVGSDKNSDYAKTLGIFDEIHQYPSRGVLKRIKFIFKLKKINFDYIFIFDGKDRSMITSFFIKSNYKFAVISNKKNNFICKLLNIKFIKDNDNTNYKEIYDQIKILLDIKVSDNNYDFLNKKLDNGFASKIPINQYIHIHLDEKWINDFYIKSYKEINPTYNEFVKFLGKIAESYNVLITTGIVDYKLLFDLKNKFFNRINDKIYVNENCNNKIYFIYKPSFDDLESILRKSHLLIACHGSITHASNSFNIKKIDIIEQNKVKFYRKYTAHLTNYSCVYRSNFSNLKDQLYKNISLK